MRKGKTLRRALLIALLSAAAPSSPGSQTVPIEGQSHLSIEMDEGDLVIFGSNRNRVEVRGEGSLSTDATTISLRRFGRGSAPVTVTCPEGMILVVQLGSGNARFVNTRGTHDIRLETGEVSLIAVAGVVQISLGKGRILGDLYPDGGGRLEVAQGEIGIRLRDGPQAELSLFVGEGTARLAAPSFVNAELEARTDEGTIRSRLDRSLSLSSDDGAKYARGTLGEGGKLLRITVRRGDIELSSNADEGEPLPLYSIPKAKEKITINGALESAWGEALTFALGSEGEVRLLWDDSWLFVCALLPFIEPLNAIAIEPDDARIHEDDAFSVFLRGENYAYRLSVNPLGTLYDAQTLEESEDSSWNSEAVARTTLFASAWVVEIAIPLARVGVVPQKNFDAHFEQVPDGEALRAFFVLAPAGEEASFSVRVEGNGEIPLEVLSEALGIPREGRIYPSTVGSLGLWLRCLGWFGGFDVSVAGDTLVIALDEPRAFFVEEVQVFGVSVFSEPFCRERLGWQNGWTTQETVETRRQATENLYRQYGYALAAAKTQRVAKTLLLEVDEGVLETISVVGASRVASSEVVREVEAVLNVPYHAPTVQEILTSAQNRLRAKHGAFRGLENKGATRANDKWTLQLVVKEEPPLQPHLSPTVRYSSVHGWEPGAVAQLSRGGKHLVAGLAFLEGIRPSDSRRYRWNYRIGVLFPLSRDLSGGVHGSRWTKMPLWQGAGSLLDSLAELLTGSSSATYYASVSRSLFLRWRPRSRTLWEVGFSNEEVRSLRRAVDRSLLGFHPRESNRPVDDGESLYVFVRGSLDGRDRPILSKDPFVFTAPPSIAVANGIWTEIVGEAGTFQPLRRPGVTKHKGDLFFVRVLGDLRAYGSLSDSASLGVRIRGQWSLDFLPSHLSAWLGGGNTLPGWRTSRLFGDGGMVGNVELRFRTRQGGLFVACFGDGGFVRPAKGISRVQSAFDVGFGGGVEMTRERNRRLGAELFRFDVAFPLTRLNAEKWAPNVVLRLNRRF